MHTWMNFADAFGNRYEFYVAFVGNFLSFFTGVSLAWPIVYDRYWMISIKPIWYNEMTIDENLLVYSIFYAGGAVGAILSAFTLKLFGRKLTMLLLATIFSIIYFMLAFIEDYVVYHTFALGIAGGSSFTVVPIYISEIVSPKKRGFYMALSSVFFSSGWVFSECLTEHVSVKTLFLIIAFSSFFYLPILLLSCPESLYYTMQKYGSGETLKLLQNLRNSGQEYIELEEIRICMQDASKNPFLSIFQSDRNTKSFFICTFILLIQVFWSPELFTDYNGMIRINEKVQHYFHYKYFEALKKTETTIFVALCVFSLLIAIVSMKVQRKVLLRISLIGGIIANSVLAHYGYNWSSENIISISLWTSILFYACGVGTISWVLLGEVFSPNIKPLAASLSNAIYCIVSFIILRYSNYEAYTELYISSGLSLLVLILSLMLLETNGKSFMEIQKWHLH
ncbi:hypothetical protein HHI36_015887 [Cryptolaemus montrouzieri]|uniref:Major facilitator superfamily (MFS) profile domain-containing protein n=1 Tax=Cryptolaemus montrouzieri TaxID=559131 RepID=A0ABD2N898_9CUCU